MSNNKKDKIIKPFSKSQTTIYIVLYYIYKVYRNMKPATMNGDCEFSTVQTCQAIFVFSLSIYHRIKPQNVSKLRTITKIYSLRRKTKHYPMSTDNV